MQRALAILITGACSSAATGDVTLYANSWDGVLYEVSPVDASLTEVGPMGMDYMFPIEFAPDGTLWGVDYYEQAFWTIDENTGAASFVWGGSSQHNVGTLDFTPAGYAQTIESGYYGWRRLTFDLDVPEIVDVYSFPPSPFLDGSMSLEYRDDGAAILITNESSRLVEMNGGGLQEIAQFDGFIGVVTGTTTIGGVTYVTAFPDEGPGSLYTMDLYTGKTALVGVFPADIAFAGLASIPEPWTMGLLGAVAARVARRRRERAE